jgi:hypothetical protein
LAYEADTQGQALVAPPAQKPGRAGKTPIPSAKPNAVRSAMSRAMALRREVDRFQQAWPNLDGPQDSFPGFTWQQLERQLSSLAPPSRAPIAAGLVQSVRAGARHKPPEMVLREILCLASALMDEENATADRDQR